MKSQDELLAEASRTCICTPDSCSEVCDACNDLDPELPCPRDPWPES